MEPKKTSASVALEAATDRDGEGKVRGYHVVSPNGDLVLARPGTLRVTAIVGEGEVINGLKAGWRLATADDHKAKAAAKAKHEAAEKAKAAQA